MAEGEEDLVRGVGDRGQRVAGEDRQRDPLGQQRLAQLVAAHRTADEQPLAASVSVGTSDARVCSARRPRRAHGRRGVAPQPSRTRDCTRDRRSVHVVIMGCGRVGSTLAHSLDAGPHGRRHRPEPVGLPPARPDFAGDTSRASASTATPCSRPASRRRRRLRRGQQRRQLQHPGRAGRPRDVRRRERRGPHLRPAPRRGLPAAGHPHGRDASGGPPTRCCAGCSPTAPATEWRDPSGGVALAEVHVDTAWVGERISRLEEEPGARVAFLTRFGEGVLPGADTVLQDGDLVHVAARPDAVATARAGRVADRPEEAH